MPPHPVYLWTLPMFHCNGWCFTGASPQRRTNICLRKVSAPLDLIRSTVTTAARPSCTARSSTRPKNGSAASTTKSPVSSPPPRRLPRSSKACRRWDSTSPLYGLTKLRPAAVARARAWKLPLDKQVELNGRQGVWYHAQECMTVIDPASMTRAVGRRDDGRSHVSRQSHDEGISEQPPELRGRLVHTAIRRQQRDGYVNQTAQGRHHFGGEHFSLSRDALTATRPSAGRVVQTDRGRVLRVPRAQRRRAHRSRNHRALQRGSRTTRRPSRSCSVPCRRPPRARSRSSSCASR